MDDYYRVLEITRNASEKDIKRAYHRLARERHPDKGTTPEQVKQLQEEFALISTAYNILKDGEKRNEYDQRLRNEESKRVESGEPPPTQKAATATRQTGSTIVRERASIGQRAFAKGMQLYTAGDYARACEFFEAAIKNNDNEAMYHARLGTALMRSHKRFSRAVTAIERAIELDPYNTEHRLALGEAYETVGSTSMAARTYREILKWDASNAEALRRLEGLGSSPGRTLLNMLKNLMKRQ